MIQQITLQRFASVRDCRKELSALDASNLPQFSQSRGFGFLRGQHCEGSCPVGLTSLGPGTEQLQLELESEKERKISC